MKTYKDLTDNQRIAIEIFYIISCDKKRVDSTSNDFGEVYINMYTKNIATILFRDFSAKLLKNDFLLFPRLGISLFKYGFLDSFETDVDGKKKTVYKINEYGISQVKKYIIPFEKTNSISLFIDNEIKILREFEEELLESGIERNLDKKIQKTFHTLNDIKEMVKNKPSYDNQQFKPILYLEIENVLASTLIDNYNKNITHIKTKQLSLENEIKNQADSKGGYIIFKNHRTNEVINVPKIPFIIWSINSNQYSTTPDRVFTLKHELMKQWKCLAGNNIKLPNDDKYHNDWIIGAGFDPHNFYHLLDTDYNWFSYLQMDFFSDYIMTENFNHSDDFTLISTDCELFKTEFKTVKALPKNINKKVKFPFYFKPFFQSNVSEFDSDSLNGFISAIAINNYEDSILDVALELSNNPYNLILTNNGTQAAHIINVAKEINVNIFEINCKPSELSYNSIYEISEIDGIFSIKMIASSDDFRTDNLIPLQDIEKVVNSQKLEISPKARNIAKLYTDGRFNIPPALISLGTKNNVSIFNNSMIARSCGSSEGSSSASFSGIFDSIILKDCNFKDSTKKVIDSFTSTRAKKYVKSLNIDLPKAGILFQEYKQAGFSCVAKSNMDTIDFEYLKNSCDIIVEGKSKTSKLTLNKSEYYYDNNNTDIDLYELKTIILEIETLLGFKNVEIEAIWSDNKWWIIQVINLNKNDTKEQSNFIDTIKKLEQIKILFNELELDKNISRKFNNESFSFSNSTIDSEINKIKEYELIGFIL